MKINFTKKEYRSLLDLVYLGDMMLDGATDGNVPKEYVVLREKIYAFAKEFDCKDLIKYDKDLDGYFETAYYEETSGVLKYIDSYMNNMSKGMD